MKQGPVMGFPPISAETGADGLEGQLEHIEREAVLKALEKARFNKTKAAELVGKTIRQQIPG